MKHSRREILRAGLAAGVSPVLMIPRVRRGYTAEDLSQRLDKKTEHLTKHDLPTPSLLLDLDILEANIDRMAAHAKAASINLRPHAKTHKCPELARRQIKSGAIGVCAATIREAESMAAAGIKGILITNEMVGRNKIERLLNLTRQHSDTISIVDNQLHAEELSHAAVAAKVTLNLLLDIDPNMRRSGIPAGASAVALAEKVMKLPNLKLHGLHCYSGVSSHVKGFAERRLHSQKALEPALELFADLKQRGLPMHIMSGGSTGTYNIDSSLSGMTELQVGSYVFMDIDYRRIGGVSGADYDDFGQSLFVIATVISQSYAGLATVDAGFKAFATDRRFGPELKGITGVTYGFGGDEHGVLRLENPSQSVKLGDRLEFIVPHCDPNVNLYDRLYCVRGDKVEAVWEIARGYG